MYALLSCMEYAQLHGETMVIDTFSLHLDMICATSPLEIQDGNGTPDLWSQRMAEMSAGSLESEDFSDPTIHRGWSFHNHYDFPFLIVSPTHSSSHYHFPICYNIISISLHYHHPTIIPLSFHDTILWEWLTIRYWKWSSRNDVSFPIKNMVILHSHVTANIWKQ